jgi:hypothetical protein
VPQALRKRRKVSGSNSENEASRLEGEVGLELQKLEIRNEANLKTLFFLAGKVLKAENVPR